MKKLTFTIFSFLAPLLVNAQNKFDIESTIRNLEQLVVKGILDADSTLLKQVWAPEFMVMTPRNIIAENREDVFRNQKAGLIDYSSFERIIEKIQINENIAITMGYEVLIPRSDLPEVKAGKTLKRKFTNIWMNKQGKWLQIARHASVICP